MNSTRNTPHDESDAFDPRWWLVPASLVATGLLVALGGYLVLHDTQQVAALTPPPEAVPIAPEPLGDLSLPDAGSAGLQAEPQEQPPTF